MKLLDEHRKKKLLAQKTEAEIELQKDEAEKRRRQQIIDGNEQYYQNKLRDYNLRNKELAISYPAIVRFAHYLREINARWGDIDPQTMVKLSKQFRVEKLIQFLDTVTEPPETPPIKKEIKPEDLEA